MKASYDNLDYATSLSSRADFRNPHSADGFSLVTVAALGAVSMLWLFAISAAVVPAYQKASESRYFTVVRSSAEAALDYTVNELNQAMAAGQVSAIDDTNADGVPVITSIPTDAIGNSLATASVRINNVAAPTTSSIYDALLVPADPGDNGWRIIEATATYAGFSRTIRAILQPQLSSTPSTTTTTQPYFTYAMFGRSYLSMSGNARSDGYDSRLGAYTASPSTANRDPLAGSVGSNGSGTLSGNAVVGGDLDIFVQPPGSSVVASRSGNATVNDEVHLNGSGSGGFDGDGSGTDNVLGMSVSPRPPDYNAYQPLQTNSDIQYPAAPTAPATAYNVGTISVSGNGRLIVDPAASAPTGSIVVSGNNTLRIPPGDYVVSSFSTSGNGYMEVLSSVTTPTRIFVEGVVPGSNAIQISGNGIVNQTSIPARMQFWYNGSLNINLSGNGNMYSTTYAPNATVNISGNGTYYGSVVANTVNNSGNGMIHYDKSLSDTTQSGALTFTTTQSTIQFSNLKTISWQEL
ncbi:MAG: hypothetical protein HY711_02425 [Candidatus Melainabacteria bacterium]|nr:hypothetical protein [Candidatus Melainabacteria bacterium]